MSRTHMLKTKRIWKTLFKGDLQNVRAKFYCERCKKHSYYNLMDVFIGIPVVCRDENCDNYNELVCISLQKLASIDGQH